MEEVKNSSLQQNMKYILIIIGIVAVALSYFMGFSKYKTDTTDIKDEVSALESRYNDLKSKESKRKDYEKDIKAAEEKYEQVLSKFDAGLSTKRIIMDTHNIATAIGVTYKFETLALTEAKSTYVFGMEEHNGIPAKKDENAAYAMVGDSKAYTVTATGTYIEVKKMLDQLMNGDEHKRRVPSNITFAHDSTLNLVTCQVVMTEYAVRSKDRTETVTEIPSFNTGIDNIFFDGLVKNADITP